MKARILITLLTIIGYFPCFGNSQSYVNEEKKDVVLDKGNEDDETKHARNPIYIPLTCYYIQGYIYLNTFTDLGEIFITITNLETGEWWEYVNISNSELICIPTSSAIGNYMVKIVTENDGSYFGYFTL